MVIRKDLCSSPSFKLEDQAEAARSFEYERGVIHGALLILHGMPEPSRGVAMRSIVGALARIWMDSTAQILLYRRDRGVSCPHQAELTMKDYWSELSMNSAAVERVVMHRWVVPLTGATFLIGACSCGKLYYYPIEQYHVVDLSHHVKDATLRFED